MIMQDKNNLVIADLIIKWINVNVNRMLVMRSYREGALNNGCTVEELREILLHTSLYCGLPAATEGFRVAEEALEARKLLD